MLSGEKLSQNTYFPPQSHWLLFMQQPRRVCQHSALWIIWSHIVAEYFGGSGSGSGLPPGGVVLQRLGIQTTLKIISETEWGFWVYVILCCCEQNINKHNQSRRPGLLENCNSHTWILQKMLLDMELEIKSGAQAPLVLIRNTPHFHGRSCMSINLHAD